MQSHHIDELRKLIVETINKYPEEKDSLGLTYTIAYVLLDIATTALDVRRIDINQDLIAKIEAEHTIRPTLHTALFLQGITMLNWKNSNEGK